MISLIVIILLIAALFNNECKCASCQFRNWRTSPQIIELLQDPYFREKIYNNEGYRNEAGNLIVQHSNGNWYEISSLRSVTFK